MCKIFYLDLDACQINIVEKRMAKIVPSEMYGEVDVQSSIKQKKEK